MKLATTVLGLGLAAGMPAGMAAAAAREGDGPVPLTSVLAAAKGYPNLLLEVRLQLVRANLKRDAVTCTGRRLGTGWGKLADIAVAPYRCVIGRRTLSVTARQTIFDANGHKLRAGDPAAAGKATRVAESNLAWTWR